LVNIDQSNSPLRPVSGKEGSIVALLGALSRGHGSIAGALTSTGPLPAAAAAAGDGGAVAGPGSEASGAVVMGGMKQDEQERVIEEFRAGTV
jgi:hypothetical protein